MKRFLLIAYNFPPYWSTGTVRVAKLCKYMQNEGWEPVVVTSRKKHFGPELRVDMTDYLRFKIYRTPLNVLDWWDGFKSRLKKSRHKTTPIPSSHGAPKASASKEVPQFKQIYKWNLKYRMERWLYPVDIHVLWAPWAFIYGFFILLMNREISVILVSGPPHTQQIVGALLTKCFPRCRFVTDFRDTWIEDMNRYYPTQLHRALEYRLERFIVETASRVTLVADDFVPLFVKKYGHPEKFVLLHNGFDPEDFKNIPLASPSREQFVLRHVGGIGQGRNISGLLRAVKQLADQGKIAPDTFQVEFYGGVHRFFHEDVNALGLERYVHIQGRIPYHQALQKMSEANALLLVFENDPNGGFYTTKFFEYLNVRRPIIVIGPERGAGRFIVQHGVGRCTAEDDVPALAQTLMYFYEQNRAGALKAHEADISCFSRKEIAKEMASLFNSLMTHPVQSRGSMNRFLLISYNFPPYWSTGTVRVGKLAKYLPAEGWEPVVLTCRRYFYGPGLRTEMDDYKNLLIYRTPFTLLEYWEFCKQKIRSWVLARKKNTVSTPTMPPFPQAQDAVPEFKTIYRVKPMDKVMRWICPIETFVFWMPVAFLYGVYLLLTFQDISLIFVSGAPYTQQLTGALLKRLFPRCRLVVDFRDAWVEDMNRYYPTRFHRWFEYRMERFVVETADRVTLVSGEVLPLFVEKYGHPEKFIFLPNGFDPDDFQDLPSAAPPKQPFTLGHFGGIGSGRNISGLLRALKKLLDDGKISSDSFRANFYGGVNHYFHREINSFGLNSLVHLHDRIPYKQGIQKMAESSALLLVVDSDPNTSFYPTKFFEYLNTRRPILVIGPERGAGRYTVQNDVGRCVVENNVPALAKTLLDFYEENRNGTLKVHQVDISCFSRKEIAKKMGAVFNSI